MQRQLIVDTARSYLDVPWHHVGRSRGGVDCVGLVIMVCHELGIPYEDQRTYTRGPQVQNFLAAIRSQTNPAADFNFRRPGQLAIFRQTIFPMHIGILAKDAYGSLTVIHAAAKHRRVVEEGLSGQIGDELIELRELIGVED